MGDLEGGDAEGRGVHRIASTGRLMTRFD
jgi:hypothetical protein